MQQIQYCQIFELSEMWGTLLTLQFRALEVALVVHLTEQQQGNRPALNTLKVLKADEDVGIAMELDTMPEHVIVNKYLVSQSYFNFFERLGWGVGYI